MQPGIVSYGVFIPRYRLKVDEIWDVWFHRQTPVYIKNVIGVAEKSVCSYDEDPIVMAYEAAETALAGSNVRREDVGALYFGSCTNMFATKSSATVVAELLGLPNNIFCMDCQFATKSGTGAMQLVYALIMAGMVNYGIAIGSDCMSRHIAPNTFPHEYICSDGAAAFLLGNNDIIAEIENTFSYVTDTPDFFRLEGNRYISRGVSEGEEFIGYEEHVIKGSEIFFKKYGLKPEDFSYAVFSQPSAQAVLDVAQKIGFKDAQLRHGMIIDKTGDPGSATPLISLALTLEQSSPGDRIFLAAYGYGAGVDIFCIKVTDNILNKKRLSVMDQTNNREYLDYKTYIKMERKLIKEIV